VTESNSVGITALMGDLRRIAESIGVEAALRLSRDFGGTALFIPKLRRLHLEERDRQIRKDYDAGIKPRRLSMKYNLSERQIWSILKKRP
jgi:Mor family transcriptional regulator